MNPETDMLTLAARHGQGGEQGRTASAEGEAGK